MYLFNRCLFVCLFVAYSCLSFVCVFVMSCLLNVLLFDVFIGSLLFACLSSLLELVTLTVLISYFVWHLLVLLFVVGCSLCVFQFSWLFRSCLCCWLLFDVFIGLSCVIHQLVMCSCL